MAATAPLIERTDIHKSCKALEAIVNAFNDYCQAAEALAFVEKKLARALKDAVGLKATNELVGNALNAAATLLESLAEVDAKFVKLIDKECEGTSNDVKKWFKKLAKEERNHDEKIDAANAKIKEAGLTYEKKAKRKDRDAGEEHTRYVNLLSTVGPELSQERHNYSLLVTQRHTTTLYSVASSVSRAADAEWKRACDSVRRFAPLIGRIGECRAYLEGAWMSDVPDGNGDPDDSNHVKADPRAREQDANGAVDEMGARVAKFPSGSTETDSSHRSPAPAFASSTSLNSTSPPSSAPSYQINQGPPSAPPSLPSRSHSAGAPPISYSPAQLDRMNMDSVRSIESLSSFPSPPAHFPLPPMAQLPVPRNMPPTSEDKRTPDGDMVGPDKPSDARNKPIQQMPIVLNAPSVSAGQPASRPVDDASAPRGNSSSQLPIQAASPGTERDSLDKDDETVKIKPMERPQSSQRRGSGNTSPGGDESGSFGRKVSRTESVVSTSSIVASMRDKFGRGDAVSAALPRGPDIPKLPNKVSDLASKYATTTDATPVPLSPRNTGFVFPSSDRSRQVSGSSAKGDEKAGSAQEKQGSKAAATDPGVTPSELNILRRRRRLEELEELDRREQVQALRTREREIEMQTKELERERDRLLALGVAASTGLVNAVPVRSHPPHSHSMVNLVPSHSGTGEAPARPVSQHGEPLALTSSRPPTDHAPYCGCQSCSASQYRDPHLHVQVIAQAHGQKEKSKSWMRRFSMPVVANAFSSSDSKKSHNIGTGIAGAPRMPGQLPYFETDSTGGISNIRPRKISFGRR